MNELINTLREQQGLTFKYTKIGEKFIHTLAEGQLCIQLGLDPEKDVVGKGLEDFLPPQLANITLEYYRRAWSGENVTYEGQLNGVHYLATLRPVIRHGEVVEVIGSCIDISDRKAMEEALKKSEEQYRLIADNMTDVIGLLDVRGQIQYISPSIEKLTGRSDTLFHGKSILELTHPDDSFHVRNKIQIMLEQKQSVQILCRLLVSEGNVRNFEIKAIPIIENDQVARILIVGRDISEKLMTEDLLRNSEKLSVIGQLAAGIAHEIRNPLTALRGFIQLLKKQSADNQSYYDVMLSELDRINYIASELLVLSKPQITSFRKNELISMLKSVLTIIETQAIMNNVQIFTDFQSDHMYIHSVDNQLKQVFMNILKNGIEAMPHGGEFIIHASKIDSEHIILRFIDNGIGIRKELLEKLGEPFYTTKANGTGLGLMVSKKIITEHNGSLLITSEEGEGTTVEIILPIT
ncbi:PAS domain-containing sensor histidine kinase [Brevibacillus ginsengisoli]|uniref:PAS domain-containing sensor histidine kinase n=1 Tax=Brevibacillus ginsengisoli TaxID=363854 RepID=UPI003CF8E551